MKQFNIEKFLNECKFGFKLNKNGRYDSVIKYDNVTLTIDGLLKHISESMGYNVYCGDRFDFTNLEEPNCDTFIFHTLCSVKIDSLSYEWFKSHGYEENVAYSLFGCISEYFVSFRKVLSLTDFKSYLIWYINQFIRKNAKRIEGQLLYKEKGPIFIECGG